MLRLDLYEIFLKVIFLNKNKTYMFHCLKGLQFNRWIYLETTAFIKHMYNNDGLTIVVDVSGLTVVSMQIISLLHCNGCQQPTLGIVYSGALHEHCFATLSPHMQCYSAGIRCITCQALHVPQSQLRFLHHPDSNHAPLALRSFKRQRTAL